MTPTVAVAVATGNEGKLSLFREVLGPLGIAVVGVDPKDAEERAAVGYESAVLAKLRGASQLTDLPVLAHDSGFEFESLGWGPGPETKRWLAGGSWRKSAPTVGERVRVVHALACSAAGREKVIIDSDERTLSEWRAPGGALLPLGNLTDGPRRAFSDGVLALVQWVESGND